MPPSLGMFKYNTYGAHTMPVSIVSYWVTAVDTNTGLTTADNGGSAVTNPATQITASTRYILDRNDTGGTRIHFRLKYTTGGTTTSYPTITVFGRADSSEPWQNLPNLAGNRAFTFVAAPEDAADGTYSYTAVDPTANVVDTNGCNEFIVGIEVAAVGSGWIACQAKVV